MQILSGFSSRWYPVSPSPHPLITTYKTRFAFGSGYFGPARSWSLPALRLPFLLQPSTAAP